MKGGNVHEGRQSSNTPTQNTGELFPFSFSDLFLKANVGCASIALNSLAVAVAIYDILMEFNYTLPLDRRG